MLEDALRNRSVDSGTLVVCGCWWSTTRCAWPRRSAAPCGPSTSMSTSSTTATTRCGRPKQTDYAAIVLDIMLPGKNGYEVCRDLRAAGNTTPILMLTAKDGEYDEAEALDTGADDYLRKPFSLVVLLARLRAMLRRGPTHTPDSVEVGDLVIDRGQLSCTRLGEEPIMLTPREFAVLEHLARRAPDVVSKAALLDDVWGLGFEGDPNIVEVYVGYLRRKLGRGYGSYRPPCRVSAHHEEECATMIGSVRWRLTAAVVFTVGRAGTGGCLDRATLGSRRARRRSTRCRGRSRVRRPRPRVDGRGDRPERHDRSARVDRVVRTPDRGSDRRASTTRGRSSGCARSIAAINSTSLRWLTWSAPSTHPDV